jgi:hypothetical protein
VGLELDNWPVHTSVGWSTAQDLKLHFSQLFRVRSNKMYINFHSIISINNTLQSIIQPTIYDSFLLFRIRVSKGDDARHGQRPLFENHFVSDIPGTIHVGDDITVVNVLP